MKLTLQSHKIKRQKGKCEIQSYLYFDRRHNRTIEKWSHIMYFVGGTKVKVQWHTNHIFDEIWLFDNKGARKGL